MAEVDVEDLEIHNAITEEIKNETIPSVNPNLDEARGFSSSSNDTFSDRNEILDKLSLREWSPLTQLLSKIPKKAQKGLSTLDLNFTCISVLPEFIAIGTNIGIVYWYNRREDVLERLRLQRGDLAPITSVNLLSSVDYMLAVGNNEGSVTILQIPKSSYEHEEVELKFRLQKKREIQIFEIAHNLHKSVITCLEWSTNGMKLFSGDMAGNIILTEIDYPQSQITSYHLFDEKYEIVQLSYANAHLLISSTFRTIIYSLADKTSHKVGNQDRKAAGHFGAVFEGGFNKNQKIYCSRQGLRLWIAETSGVVNKTIKFKNLIEESHPYIPVINPTAVKLRIPPKELQFGKLHMFMGKFIATSHKDVLLLFDPERARIIGTCLELKSILSIGVHQNEIFILETGRNIIRISSEPDSSLLPRKSNSSDFEGIKKLPDIMTSSISDISHSLNFLKSKLKETSRGALPKISPIITTIKTVVLESNSNIQDCLPPVIPLPNIPDIIIEERENDMMTVSKDRFEGISKESYEDVIFHTEKKGKKKKKKLIHQEMGSPIDVMSNSSYSTNSEDLPSTSSNDLGKRKNSLESMHSENSTSTNTEGGESTGNAEIVRLNSQSNSEVSNETIEEKEAILAKMLNWPILARGNLTMDEEFRDRTPSPVGRSDHESSTSSLLTICNSPDEEESQELSDILTKADSEETLLEPESNIADRLSEILLLNNEESYHDIYNSNSKYYELRRNVDIFPHQLLGGDSSSMSFGPPSGSSQLEEKSDKSLSLLDTIEAEMRSSLEDLMAKEDPMKCGDKEEIEREEEEENNLKFLMNEIEDVEVQATIGNHNWLQYNLPSTLSSFVCCDRYAVCIDSKNAVYYTSMGELSLTWVKTGYKANCMAISPSGEVVWRIKRGSLLVLRSPSPSGPFSTNDSMEKTHWDTVYENIAFAAIDDKYGWVITTSGEVLVTGSLNLISFTSIATPWRLNSIRMRKNMVFGLTTDGKLIYRGGLNGEACPFGFDWKEMRGELPHFTALAFGPKDSLLLADGQGSFYFVPHFISVFELSTSRMFKVETSDFTNCAITQNNGINAAWKSITKLTDSFRYDRLANLLQGKPFILSASSKSYIWLSHPGSNVIHLNKTALKGYNWTKLSLEQPKDGAYWTNVFAGSIYNTQGQLWLQDSNGMIYHTAVNGGKIKSIDLPNEKPITCVSFSPEALWMLSCEGHVYVRCNISRNDRIGSGWNRIPLSPLEDSLFVHLSCGSEVAWAVESSGNIYMRIGSLQPPGVNDIFPAWVPVEGRPSQPNAFFTKVYVDSNDRIVWALDNYKNIYAREAIFPDFPIGTRWVLVPGIEADRLCVSDVAVWALSPSGEIFCRNGISKTNFVGDFWQKIPGNANILTTSLCDQVWALDESGSLIKLRKEILKFGPTSETKFHSTLSTEDCEWEIL